MELRHQGPIEFAVLQQWLMHLCLSEEGILPSQLLPTHPPTYQHSCLLFFLILCFWKHDWHFLEKLILWFTFHHQPEWLSRHLGCKTESCDRQMKIKPSRGLLRSAEEWLLLWFSPVPKGKMATEGSEHTSLCLISSSAPRTQPTVPSPPHTSTRKEGTLENVWNLHSEEKQGEKKCYNGI